MAHDYLIIGAGPAGLRLAALPERDGRDHADPGQRPRFDTAVPRVAENLENRRDLPAPFVGERLVGA
ncbi:hypothetical protein [Saccharothrix stipae]